MHRISKTTDIPDGDSRGFELGTSSGDTVNLFVVRQGEQFFAYENRCPHLGVNLDWIENAFLDDDRKHIQCATHMALFKIEDGHCIAGPCVGDHLTALPVQVKGDELYVDVSSL